MRDPKAFAPARGKGSGAAMGSSVGGHFGSVLHDAHMGVAAGLDGLPQSDIVVKKRGQGAKRGSGKSHKKQGGAVWVRGMGITMGGIPSRGTPTPTDSKTCGETIVFA